MKKFLNEFKAFAMRGNVIDLAVGVIIGAAFQAIVKSLVDDIISPLIGIVFQTDFNDLKWVITEGTLDPETLEVTGEVAVRYGAFITAIINFIIMAFVIFLMVKALNKLAEIGKKPTVEEPAAPTTKVCPFCCSEININATKCPHCASMQPVEETEE